MRVRPQHRSFQSTRPRGARLAGLSPAQSSTRFNPRARVGRDMKLTIHEFARLMFQSTRPRGARPAQVSRRVRRQGFQSTRPRGARLDRLAACSRQRCFNPRARVGRDAPLTSAPSTQQLFQSTRPRGARLFHRLCKDDDTESFNPRARVGRDSVTSVVSVGNFPFQSTRPRGARLHQRLPRRIIVRVSIHAPAWGATFPFLT